MFILCSVTEVGLHPEVDYSGDRYRTVKTDVPLDCLIWSALLFFPRTWNSLGWKGPLNVI